MNIQLGKQKLTPVWMAPMAGVTDKPFRLVARELGCGMAFTEMISAKAIEHNNRRTWHMLDLVGEAPIGVQLFGSDPDVMAAAATVAAKQGADVVDINMGCPVPKIVGNGEGAALMCKPELAARIVAAVVAAVAVPVTVKIRAGWDENSINAVPFARKMVGAGAAAVTVHGRTRAQMYCGKADWDIIGAIAAAVDVPVIGNGDVWTGADAQKMLAHTGCAGVMVARGVMGNPWLFREINAVLAGKKAVPPSPAERIAVAKRHLDMELEYRPQRMAVLHMRKHLAWYLKGLPGTKPVKERIFRETDPKAIKAALDAYVACL